MNKFSQSYKERKIDDLMALVASDPNVVLIGTGVYWKVFGFDEIKARAERDWTQSEDSSFEFGWTSISRIGSVALVAAEVTARVKIEGEESVFPWRFWLCWIIEKVNGYCVSSTCLHQLVDKLKVCLGQQIKVDPKKITIS